MNKITKVILFSVIVLFLLGIALYSTIKKKFNKEETSTETMRLTPSGGRGMPLNVNVKVIEPEALVDYIQVTGSLIPDEEVDLTFEASGKITNIFFLEGTAVAKGQLLAKVNDKPLLAELQKLEAQAPLAEDRVFRQKSLLEKDAVSKEAYEQVNTELEKLHADIDLVKSRIAQTELRAPFDGIIGLRRVSEGAYASPTTVIATLTRITPLKIEFSVPERYANMIHPGINIVFQTPPDLANYNASIYAVESRVDLNTRSLTVRALFPNTSGRLKPGKTATIEIKSNELKNALLIPNESVIAEMGRDIAYIYSEGKAKRVELVKGIRSESNIQILEGLSAGDTVILSGIMQLRDGLPVTIDNVLQ
ncbi:MAG: efflux RND transporter periplasmic adaptor subunit [Dysgonamonadaceae bacterium]|jgi:membrane fusion protein (multidrug efflux system)|nr:efflux RND transporter periplasmic adaptor subunit [Dysgonamonadaceae bacterium]